MKKFLIVVILFLVILQFSVSEQIDNIVLLDTSESMFPYYSGTIDFLIKDIVQKQLQSGDTFHLLSFNDYPEYEISRTIRNESDIKDIFDRIILLQPLGKYTDLISAFSFLYEYTEKLQLNSVKRIIILTDGIHDPPPGSPYPVSSDNSANIVKISENMKKQGWKVTLVQFPITKVNAGSSTNTEDSSKTGSSTNTQESTKTEDSSVLENNIESVSDDNNLFPIISKTLDEPVITITEQDKNISNGHPITGAPEIIYPYDFGKVGLKFEAVFQIINHSNKAVLLKLNSVTSNDRILFNESQSIKLNPNETKSLKIIINLPENIQEGSYTTPIELIFDDSYRAYPRNGFLKYIYDPEVPNVKRTVNSRIILYIIIGIVLIIALIYLLIKVIKSLSSSKNSFEWSSRSDSTTKDVSGTPKVGNKHIRTIQKGKIGQIAIEMIVRNQNRQIGHRNIHFIGEGHPLSVGGAGSEYFLIFIIATGKRIGQIVMEDGNISFIPKEKDFFPDLAGHKLINCLSTPIKVVNKKGVETSIVFKEWISPVERLNRIMHLLDKKGLPDFKY